MGRSNLVGIASLVALFALTATACSSTSGDDGGDDASDEDRPKPDASRPDPEAGACALAPPSPRATYPAPRVQRGACDQGTIAAIAGAATFDAIENILAVSPPSCQACLNPSAEGDAQWGPSVQRGTAEAVTGDPTYYGGCIRAYGFPAACGDTFQRLQDCSTALCSECQTNEEFRGCIQGSTLPGGACEALVQPVLDCSDAPTRAAFLDRCESFARVVAAFCGPNAGVPVDGGAGDGGDGG